MAELQRGDLVYSCGNCSRVKNFNGHLYISATGEKALVHVARWNPYPLSRTACGLKFNFG